MIAPLDLEALEAAIRGGEGDKLRGVLPALISELREARKDRQELLEAVRALLPMAVPGSEVEKERVGEIRAIPALLRGEQ